MDVVAIARQRIRVLSAEGTRQKDMSADGRGAFDCDKICRELTLAASTRAAGTGSNQLRQALFYFRGSTPSLAAIVAASFQMPRLDAASQVHGSRGVPTWRFESRKAVLLSSAGFGQRLGLDIVDRQEFQFSVSSEP